MNLKITQETIHVKPKIHYLSSTELTHLRNLEVDVPSAGLKRTLPKKTDEEKLELENLYEQFQKQLSKPRIERLAGRAVGEWDSKAGAVHVIRKDGKFGTFGYNGDGKHYLEYYEAMFLLEVNRLQLEYNSRILSIEQAYLLLMGEESSKKFNEYLVYSHFTRVGYILVKHQNINFPKHQIESVEDCIWAIFEAELQNEAAPDHVKKCPYYAATKKQFDQIRNNIRNQNSRSEGIAEEIDLNFGHKIKPNLKRKAEDDGAGYVNNWNKAKRRRDCVSNSFNRSLIDFLKDEDEYKQFREQFEKFEIVPLTIYDEEAEMDETQEHILSINFDVYLHNEGFRKSSPHIPNFRVIILQPEQNFPTHKEIFFTHRRQLNPVPLLLVTVNDSKQIQAFLYYFS